MNDRNTFTFDSSMAFVSPEQIQQMQDKKEYEGDNDYVQYKLPYFINTERMFICGQGNMTPNKIRAFTIANKATTALDLNRFDDATKMAHHALQLDPLCIDAWSILSKALNPVCDGDTIVCSTREVLNFSRNFFQRQFGQNDGMFYTMADTRPYIRILLDIGHTALQSEQLDVSTFVNEEIVRLNHHDNTSSRDILLTCYIKLIGRIKRFPHTRPIRTIEQAEQLINCKFDGENFFEENNLTVRWAKICFAYLRKENWKKMAKEEYEKNDLMFKVIFNDLQIDQIPPSNPLVPHGMTIGNKGDDVRLKGRGIKEALNDWPEFVIELCKLIKGKANKQFVESVYSIAPDPDNEQTKEYKDYMLSVGNKYLNQGRSLLANKNFVEAEKNFTLAKRGFYEASLPSRRCYENTPFAVFSNRATSTYYLKMWNLLRIDTRYTLVIKPDHERTYLRLVKLAQAFNATQLIEDFQKIENMVKNKEVNGQNDWKKLADEVVGLTSITAFAFAAEGILTQEIKNKLIETGIEDFYCTINIGPEYSVLPWLKPSDLDKKVL